MTPDEFRRHGHEVVEWVATLHGAGGGAADRARVAPGEIRAMLPAAAPEEPEPFEALLRDLDEIVLPGITHWQSPGWFAYFPANASPPSILAELVSAGLGAQGMIWSTSPALTEIEAHVLDWLVDLLGLPQHFKTAVGPGGGVIQMSASDSTHLVHVVARERATRAGAPLDRLVAYGSSQAHSSVERGARVAGFAHVRKLDVDDAFALRPDALRAAIEADRAAGLHPAIVTSAIGTTGTGAVDPIAEVADIASEHGLWHHVDAAWAGSAMLCEEHRPQQAGAERADSYTFNPHKWLFTNFDCNVLWVADRGAADRDAVDPPALPAQRGHGVRRGDRLPRLARAAGPPLPRAEAVVGAAQLRRRGPARAPARARRAGAGARAPRRRAPAAGARRAGRRSRSSASATPTATTATDAARGGDQRRADAARHAVDGRRHPLRPRRRRPDAHDRGRRRAPLARDRRGAR